MWRLPTPRGPQFVCAAAALQPSIYTNIKGCLRGLLVDTGREIAKTNCFVELRMLSLSTVAAYSFSLIQQSGQP